MASPMRAVSHGDDFAAGLSLLIVDDDSWMREACRALAEKLGFHVHTADSSVSALLHLASSPADVVLVDLHQTAPEGLQLLQRIKRMHSAADVIMVGPHLRGEAMAAALKTGAFECLHKPFHTEELKGLLERAAGHLQSRREQKLAGALPPGRTALIGKSQEIQKLLRMIPKVASGRHPVLIIGESGTGKEMLARSIHFASALPPRSFAPVDCACPQPAVIDAELFGAERNSGCTIFLDEVGEMPLELQGRLVRALQDHELRTASKGTIPFNPRLIAGTRRDLEPAARQGSFRRDLYLRLNVVSLRLPPLRERREDIPVLAEHILKQLAATTGRSYTVAPEAMKLLMAHSWPGNVTELEGCLQRAVTLSSGSLLQAGDLPAYLEPSAHAFAIEPDGGLTEIVPLAELEKKSIVNALERLKGDKITTARLLGIGKTTLYRKLREYGIADRWVTRPPER